MRRRFLYTLRSEPPSYLIYTDTMTGEDVRLDFSPADTSIAAFGGTGASMTVNGVSVFKPGVKLIVFGSDYVDVASVANSFCYGFTACTVVDISGLRNLQSFGSGFFGSARGETGVLSEIHIGQLDFSSITGISPFAIIPARGAGAIYAETLALAASLQALNLSFANWTLATE